MAKNPEPIDELDPDGRQLYFRIKRWVCANGEWLDPYQLIVNQAALHAQRARLASAVIAANGLTTVGSAASLVAHPAVRIWQQECKAFEDCLRELGLTPRARAAMHVEAKPTGSDPLSEAFGR